MKSRLRYLFSQFAGSLLGDSSCPNCGCHFSRRVDRKWLVSQLRQCDECSVNLRWPADRADTAETLYQDAYRQAGLTTDLPSDSELESLLSANFRNSEKDFRDYTTLLVELAAAQGKDPGDTVVVDYGANWGYFLYQLARAGFSKAVGVEISRPRRCFGEDRLGVYYADSDSIPACSVDILISLHVIEHLPRPDILFENAFRLLRPGGVLVIECPNGSHSARKLDYWSAQWGQVHPFYVGDEFLIRGLSRLGFTGSVISPELLRCEDGFSGVSDRLGEIVEASTLPLNSRMPSTGSLLFVGRKAGVM